MSVIMTFFDVLSGDAELKGLLANHSLAPDYPAIYDRWAIEDVLMPYMVMSYGFSAGDIPTKINGSLILDIFTAGNSTIQAEAIRDRLREIFEYATFFSEGEGTLRTHYMNDGNIPEPEDDVVHWMMEFQVIYFDASVIHAINKRSE